MHSTIEQSYKVTIGGPAVPLAIVLPAPGHPSHGHLAPGLRLHRARLP